MLQFDDKIYLLDGATGSNLNKAGMPIRTCVEQWVLEHPKVVNNLQKAYLSAGTQILYAPTFSANRISLKRHGLADQVEMLNRKLIINTKKAVEQWKMEEGDPNRPIYIAGDITMTGEQLEPYGELLYEELVSVYRDQMSYQLQEGVDLFVVETMMSLKECKAAVSAAKSLGDCPVAVTLTFHGNGKTMYGTDAATAARELQAHGANAVGANCSTGPTEMADIIKEMKAHSTIPIIGKPNAGMPKMIDGATVYEMDPAEFAFAMGGLVKAGATLIGGCCGTTPDHIEALAKILP